MTVTENFFSHQLENGLMVVAESMEWLESVAFALLLPAGYIYDPAEQLGLSNFTCEMVQRGCGARESRQFVEDLDYLGVDRSVSVSAAHTSFGGAVLADKLEDVLAIYADLVRRPHLPAEQLDEGRLVCLQELWSLEDDLAQRAMLRLRSRHYGDPWGRGSYGTEASLRAIQLDDIRRYFQNAYQPRGAILSVAGKIDWPRLRDSIERHFGDWTAGEPPSLIEQPAPGGYEHVPFASNQTQIAVAYASVPYRDPDYFQARGAVGILSDGMSSRLFTEVRENRGLCYTVYGSCHSLPDRGSVMCYAGTSTERAQETLDVLLAELQRLSQGVQQDELNRLKARIKSTLIMQQESSAARAIAIASDWYHLGRVLRRDELSQIIDGLSCDSINRYLADHRPHEFTVVTLGEKELEVPVAVS